MKKWTLLFAFVLLFTSVAACFPVDNSTLPGTTGTPNPSTTVNNSGTTVPTVTTVGSMPPTSSVPPTTPPTTLPPTAPTTKPTVPTTTPTVPTLPGTQPTVPTLPGTQPTVPTLPGTQPTVPTLPGTQPTVPTLPGTQPTVPTLPGTQPTEPSIPGTEPTTPPSIPPVGLIGWQQQGDQWFYYDDAGEMTVGFAEIEGGMYYFGNDGAMHTGWLDMEDGRYYFSPSGIMQTGWILVESVRYYMDEDGTMHTGWLDVDGKRYYLLEDGTVHVGWLFQQEEMYYLQENGVMAKGMLMIDGEKNYFTSSGAYIMLVNPWNHMPEGYEPELKKLEKYGAGTQKVDVRCYDALMQMLNDCKKESQTAIVCSSYRSIGLQETLFENRVKRFMNQGYDRAEAERRAAQVVAVPGTSEHHLGLAVDIVDNTNWNLDESQEKTPAQKWLMANSWKYGFILRYPVGKTEVTGIIYEPWHYRYVGKELAKELHEGGLTLEEYLDKLTQEAST